jgi:hypothetical protein
MNMSEHAISVTHFTGNSSWDNHTHTRTHTHTHTHTQKRPYWKEKTNYVKKTKIYKESSEEFTKIHR